MNKYSQELRVFVACCPSGGKISQKLMKKINEAADKFDTLEQQRDDLLAACEMGRMAYEGLVEICKQGGMEIPEKLEAKEFIE